MIRLIIVEDHTSLIDGLQLLFKNDPEIEVIATALDGVELMEVLENKKAHVILTDISMPRMNGVEVWCEASAYIQKDKSLKISINKTSSGSAAAPGAAASAAPSGDAWDAQF